MNRRWMVWVVAVAVLLVAFFWFRAGRGDGVLVEVWQVVRQPVFRSYVTASGEIVATRFADIGSNVMGKIVSLPVNEGDVVVPGQLLARIDPVQARSEVDAAGAAVAALEAEVRGADEQLRAAKAEERSWRRPGLEKRACASIARVSCFPSRWHPSRTSE